MTTETIPTSNDVFAKICLRIILEQENMIGVLSWTEAERVSGLKVIDRQNRRIEITGEPRQVVNNLVETYEKLFGKLSREISRNCVLDIIEDMPKQDVPDDLR